EQQLRTATAAPAAIDPQAISAARTEGYAGGLDDGRRRGFAEAVNQANRHFDSIKTAVALAVVDASNTINAIASHDFKFVLGQDDIRSGSLQAPAKAADTPR